MIHIENNWYIDADEMTFILKRDAGRDKHGDIIWDCRYFPSLDMAVRCYMKIQAARIVNQFDCEILEALEKIHEEMHRINVLMGDKDEQ